jgi:hypothetical protein
LFQDQRIREVDSLGIFFSAVSNRGWDAGEASFHLTASLFTLTDGMSLPSLDGRPQPALKYWTQNSVETRMVAQKLNDLDLVVTDKSAIAVLKTKRRHAGPARLILSSSSCRSSKQPAG